MASKFLWFGAGIATNTIWNSYKNDILDEAKQKKVTNINKFILANVLLGTSRILNDSASSLYKDEIPPSKKIFEYDPILDRVFSDKE